MDVALVGGNLGVYLDPELDRRLQSGRSRKIGRACLQAGKQQREQDYSSQTMHFFAVVLAIYSRIRLPSNYETVVIAHYLCMHKVPTG